MPDGSSLVSRRVITLEEARAENLRRTSPGEYEERVREGYLRGVQEDRHYFQEILVNSDHLVHVFLRSVVNQDIVAVVVCRKSANTGMLFAQARIVMKQLDAGLGG